MDMTLEEVQISQTTNYEEEELVSMYIQYLGVPFEARYSNG